MESELATVCPSCGTANLEGEDECANCGADLRTVDLPKPTSRLEQSVMHLPLTSLDLTVIHAISPDDPVEVAAQTLRRQKVDVLEVVEAERAAGPVVGVICTLGGQTPLALAQRLKDAGVPVLGTAPEAIDDAEHRGAFSRVLGTTPRAWRREAQPSSR